MLRPIPGAASILALAIGLPAAHGVRSQVQNSGVKIIEPGEIPADRRIGLDPGSSSKFGAIRLACLRRGGGASSAFRLTIDPGARTVAMDGEPMSDPVFDEGKVSFRAPGRRERVSVKWKNSLLWPAVRQGDCRSIGGAAER